MYIYWAITLYVSTPVDFSTSEESLSWRHNRIYKAPNTLSDKLKDFIVWCHIWRKNWVNCSVLTGNSAWLRTVLSSRLSNRELCISLRESHSFLSLPADITMASSQGTSVSSNPFSRWASHDIFLFKYHFLLHILRFLFSFSDNIMADVASKQQTTALSFIHHSHTHKKTHRTDKPDGKPEHSVQFFVQVFFFYTVKLYILNQSVCGH